MLWFQMELRWVATPLKRIAQTTGVRTPYITLPLRSLKETRHILTALNNADVPIIFLQDGKSI